MAALDSEKLARNFRGAALDIPGKRLLLTNLIGTKQEADLTLPPNCAGFGRIHHFRRTGGRNFPTNPLPIDPALAALGLPPTDMLQVQVFQSSVCNWRCWYCYVPFNLLSGDPNYSKFVSTDELIELYLAESAPPKVIDLSGGQPELTPEWVFWFIESVEKYGLTEQVYIWSDDNLSNDYFWTYLESNQRTKIAQFANYGRVGCFKGFDDTSFSFNTGASPNDFRQQFSLMRRYIASEIDMYGYLTLTTPIRDKIAEKMIQFVDDLQDIHENLPLRVIPLEVRPFSANAHRVRTEQENAIENQYEAVECWNNEITKRFHTRLIETPVYRIQVQ